MGIWFDDLKEEDSQENVTVNNMKNKLLKLIILLVCSYIYLGGCSEASEGIETFTPEHTSEVGKLFQIDSTNFIMINGGRIIEDKGNKI